MVDSTAPPAPPAPTALVLPLFSDVADPAKANKSLRELYRTALNKKAVALAVNKIVGNGRRTGHKVLLWDRALVPVEADIGTEALKPFAELTDYTRATKLRSVVREKLVIGPDWRPTGAIAERVAALQAPAEQAAPVASPEPAEPESAQ